MRKTNQPQPTAPARVPPQDIEAEMAVLGSMLICGDRLGFLVDALGLLTGDQFYRSAHGEMFEAMRSLYAKDEPIDIVTLGDACLDAGVMGKDKSAIMLYLMQLAEYVPTPASIMHYAQIVLEKWRLRQVIEKASEAASQAWEEAESGEIIATAQQSLSSLMSVGQRGAWKDAKTLASEYLDELSDRHAGGENIGVIRTGFLDLDSLVGGFRKGELSMIAARPSQGKTALFMEMGVRQAKASEEVAVFSLEMKNKALVNRMVSSSSSIPSTTLDVGRLSDEQWERVTAAVGDFYDLGLHIQDEGDLTVSQIDSKIRELTLKGPLDVVYIDYLTLIQCEGSPSENYSKRVGDIVKALKNIAKRYDIHVCCLAQLSRSVERREDKRPMLSDLRESGNIEEHIDMCLFIYRPAYYARKEEVGDEVPGTDPEEAEIIVAKNRNGATGMVRLEFTPAYTRFANASTGVY